MTARPNILIIMVDQLNGKFFPDGPAAFLHAPNLKALAARDNNVPFYVALPSPTIDWTVEDGVKNIPIEQRSADEVSYVQGRTANGDVAQVRISPDGTDAVNFGFDVTPARLVSGLITERGVCAASRDGLRALFPERA